MLFELDVLADDLVGHVLNLADFFVGNLLEVAEVETERVRSDERALLLNMCAKHFTHAIVEDVGCRVVALSSDARFLIDNSRESCCDILWQCCSDADRKVVLTLGVDYLKLLSVGLDVSAVSYLTTHLAIEWSLGKYDLIEGLVLLLYLTVTENFGLALEEVISHKLWSACLDLNPVAILHGSSIAGTFLLSLHVLVELLFVDGESVLAADELCEVERETKSVEESECLVTVDHCASLGLGILHDGVDTLDAVFECAEE